MKRILGCVLILVLLLFCASAMALPDDSGSTLLMQGASGEIVVRVQTRLAELGYLNFKPTGNFQGMTVNAVKQFQQIQTKPDGSAMIADGTIGSETLGTLFLPSAARAPIPQQIHIPFGPALSGTAQKSGQLIAWSQVQERLTVGNTYSITDYNTSKTFSVVYLGGEKHAEVECATDADTEVYKEVFGGEFNYSKRPVLINAGGTLIAASMQGEPHGDDSVAYNGMNGHSCLYFEGSLSHVGALPDTEHLKQVYVAAGR